MKKIKIYLDTSVIGGCFDNEFEEYSSKLIDEIISNKKIGIISELTVKEISNAPKVIIEYFRSIEKIFSLISSSTEAENLADYYLKEKIVSSKFRSDCLHIAIATVNNVDLLVSWNFKHIVNYDKIIKFNSVNLKNGYKTLQIYSPREVIIQND
jgi:hypothetical protein